jgi:hypothetical protein
LSVFVVLAFCAIKPKNFDQNYLKYQLGKEVVPTDLSFTHGTMLGHKLKENCLAANFLGTFLLHRTSFL